MALVVSDVSLRYGVVRALRGVNLEVADGAVVALLGSNGAGKSSLLRAISGNLQQQRATMTGEVSLDGDSLVGIGSATTVRRGVVQVPEGRRIFTTMTVQENLKLGGLSVARSSRKATEDEIYDLFPVLAERRSQPGGLLSGGEQQMLAIGRAMMARPRVLMLDEPSLGLAPKMIRTIAEIITRINSRGTSILLIEQNAAMALEVASHAYVLELGSIALSGPTSDPVLMDRVREVYLGVSADPAAVDGVTLDAPPPSRPTLTRWQRSR
jgi:branched-chain amino acid transport system ATP-binding protein